MTTLSDTERQHRQSGLRIADELWNKRNYDVVDEEYDPLVEMHTFSDPEAIVGTKAVKDFAKRYHEAFSDFHVEIFDMTAKEDRVFARYRMTGTHDGTLETQMGDVPPTHRKMDTWGLIEGRYEGGLCVEEWNSTDQMTLATQLGFAPE
ncbi:ester cyclase [Haloferax sp. YSMS24]|uniref:ester cyclase n=1 Tax=unclassified Haloferax TaxID=2625095 RepID=UPI00398D4344